MNTTHADLCAAIVSIAWFDEPVSNAVINQLAELELITVTDGEPKLTAAGERLYSKIEAGDDIPEFGQAQRSAA
jgi:hypothetical protein